MPPIRRSGRPTRWRGTLYAASIVALGGGGMPVFNHLLARQQVNDVAVYVASSVAAGP